MGNLIVGRPNPFQHIQAGQVRHFEIEEHQARQRTCAPEGAFFRILCASQVIDGGSAVSNRHQRVGDLGAHKGALQ
jgi:hypothetical protein